MAGTLGIQIVLLRCGLAALSINYEISLKYISAVLGRSFASLRELYHRIPLRRIAPLHDHTVCISFDTFRAQSLDILVS